MCGNTGSPANCDGQGITLVSGGMQPGTDWDALYSGTFTISGVFVSSLPGGSYKLAKPLATFDDLDFYVFAYDNAGNFGLSPIGTYTLASDCP
jgi:hypothetical protein